MEGSSGTSKSTSLNKRGSGMERNAIQCDLECCTNTSSPYQPFSAAIAQATKQEMVNSSATFRNIGTQSFLGYHFALQETGYSAFTADHAFTTKNCRLVNVFTIDGYKNWKKARCKFESHENSDCHIEAIYKFKTRSSAGVDVQLNDQIKKTHVLRQKAFLKVLSSLRLSFAARACNQRT